MHIDLIRANASGCAIVEVVHLLKPSLLAGFNHGVS